MNPNDFDIGVLYEITRKSYLAFWLFAIVGILSIILARISNSAYIISLFNFSTNINNKKVFSQSIGTPLLFLNFVIAISLQFYLFNENTIILDYKDQSRILTTVFIAVLVYFLIKSVAQYVGANLFLRNNVFELSNTIHIYQIVGLILLPLAILSMYQSDAFKHITSLLAIFILFSSTIYSWIISFSESQKYKISYFYIFLYLCTLEIIPVILIAKYLLD